MSLPDLTPHLHHITDFRIPVRHAAQDPGVTSEHYVRVFGDDGQHWQVMHSSPPAGYRAGQGFLGNTSGFHAYWHRTDRCWIPAVDLPENAAPGHAEELDWFWDVTAFDSIQEALEVAVSEAVTIQVLQDDYDVQFPPRPVDDTPGLKFN